MHREDLSILVLTVLVSLKFHLSLGYKMLNHSMHGAGRRCSHPGEKNGVIARNCA